MSNPFKRTRRMSTTQDLGIVSQRAPSAVVNSAAASKAMNMKSRSRRSRTFRGSLGKRVSRLEKDTILNVDRKYSLQTDGVLTTVTQAVPFVLRLNNIAAGGTQTTRVGNFANMGKGHCSMALRWDHSAQTATAGNHACRVLIVLTKNADGAALQVSDLFRSATPLPHEFFDFGTKAVFQNHRILYDKIFEGQNPPAAFNGSNVDTGDTRTTINFGWNANNFKTQWRGANGTDVDLLEGAISMVILTSSQVLGRLRINYDVVQYFTEKKAY